MRIGEEPSRALLDGAILRRGCVPVAAHSLRECRRAMAQRRGQFAGPRVSGHTDACTHVGEGGRSDRFSSIEKRRRERAGRRAPPERVWESDGTTARAVCRTFGIRSHRCLHAYWRGRSKEQISSIEKRRRECTGCRARFWESGRERWRDGAGCYRTLGFRPPRSLHAYWRGRATRPIFDHR